MSLNPCIQRNITEDMTSVAALALSSWNGEETGGRAENCLNVMSTIVLAFEILEGGVKGFCPTPAFIRSSCYQ